MPGWSLATTLSPNTMRQLLTFGGLSLIGTAGHYLLLWVWVQGFNASPWWGSVCGATLGLIINYFLHSRITFADAQHRGILAFLRFTLSALAGFIANAVIMGLALHLGWHWLASQLIATGFAFASNYLLAKFWVFASRATS